MLSKVFKPPLSDPLDQLPLSDFVHHPLRQSYLTAYSVEVVLDDWYTMVWPHGFMMATSKLWGLEIAEAWSFYFVWHWMRGTEITLAEQESLRDEVLQLLTNFANGKDFVRRYKVSVLPDGRYDSRFDGYES